MFHKTDIVKSLTFVFTLLSQIAAPQSPANPSHPFWELRPEQVRAMLTPAPKDNQERFTRLRGYFHDLHCPDDRLEEVDAGKRSRRHGEKNLICTLPGDSTDRLVVAVRYDHFFSPTREANSWNDAVMLPLLYNGLLAQPKTHTFIFAELCGSTGEEAFLSTLQQHGRPAPKAIVILSMLALGEPSFYTRPTTIALGAAHRRVAIENELVQEAASAAQLTGSSLTQIAPGEIVENKLLADSPKIPAILIYSNFNHARIQTPTSQMATDLPPTEKAFKQDFEYLAYYLGRIDSKLTHP